MSRKCDITKKGNHRGNIVSHANNKANKCWRANIHTKRVFDSQSGTWIKLKVSARALRTINKKGVAAVMRDAGLKMKDYAI